MAEGAEPTQRLIKSVNSQQECIGEQYTTNNMQTRMCHLSEITTSNFKLQEMIFTSESNER